MLMELVNVLAKMLFLEPVHLLLLFFGGIGALFIPVIVPLILFPMYVYRVRHEAIPHNGKLVWSGISLLVPILCVIVALIIRVPMMKPGSSQFFGPLYQLLLLIFELFMVINAVILFNIFRRVVTNKFGVVTVLYGLLTIVVTLLGMALVGVEWFIILI